MKMDSCLLTEIDFSDRRFLSHWYDYYRQERVEISESILLPVILLLLIIVLQSCIIKSQLLAILFLSDNIVTS